MITNYGYYFIIYIAICAFYSFYVVASVKSKRFIPDFLLVFWIMTFQIYASRQALYEFPRLGMVKGSYELIAFLLIVIVLLEFLSKDNKQDTMKLLSYEKYLYAYFFLSLILIRLHGFLGNLTPYLTFFWTKLYLTGIVFYYVLTKVITRETIQAILKALIVLGFFSSLISLYQFFEDSKFMRLASFYDAFGKYDRASGIFTWPYDNGLMMIIAIFATVFTVKNIRIKVILIGFFSFTMVLVFTRGVWLSFLGVLLIHGFVYHKNRMKKMIVIIPLTILIIFIVINVYVYGFQLLSGSQWEERVFADTVTTRLVLYKFTIDAIPNKWLIGYGDYKNNIVYFKAMVNLQHELAWALGQRGGLHNVILQEAFVRGIFPPIFLIMYFIKFFKYNFRESIRHKSYLYCIPNYFTLSFFLYVFSVGEYLQSRTGYLTLLFFAMVSAIHHKNIDISNLTLGSISNSLREVDDKSKKMKLLNKNDKEG